MYMWYTYTIHYTLRNSQTPLIAPAIAGIRTYACVLNRYPIADYAAVDNG